MLVVAEGARVAALGGPLDKAMETAFADFDRAAGAGGATDRLRATAARLLAAFPPDRASMELASQGMGCFAHS